MSKRRDFIKSASLGALVGTGIFTSSFTKGEAKKMKKKIPNLGIITNTLKNEFEKDYQQALREVSDLGYTCIEGGVPEGTNAKAYGQFLKSLDLQPIITGGSMGGFEEDFDKTLKTAEELGVSYISCYWPWLSSADNLTYDETMKAAENLNKHGKRSKEAGFHLTWHNHDKEFVKVNDHLVFDLLMENTDPQYVNSQLDWYWVFKGNADPVDLFKHFPGRFPLVHVKDMNNNKDRGISCVGQGIIDFEPIFKESSTGGVKYFVLENEKAIKGIACAKAGYNLMSDYL